MNIAEVLVGSCEDMDIGVLKKEELLLLAVELSLDINSRLRKPEIRSAIIEGGFEEDELSEAWEKICEEKKQREEEKRERAEEKERQERREQRQAEIELERIKLEQARLARSADAAPPHTENLKMTSLLQPYKTGEDIGLYLINFERICEKHSFHQDTWPERLLALLPGEASQVVARLSAAEAGVYSSVKSTLLAKYRLSTEEFRRRFRRERKKPGESFVEFACSLSDNFSEWVKGAGADNLSKLRDLICLEQFYDTLPDNVRLWVKDRQEGVSVRSAAQLADEYVASRGFRTPINSAHHYQRPAPRPQAYTRGPQSATKEREETNQNSARAEGKLKEPEKNRKEVRNHLEELESRAKALCFKCNETGHFARNCSKGRPVFACVSDHPSNLDLLKPYTTDLMVNDKRCRVLRDSAATMDVVHPNYVKSEDYLSECAWIRQAVSEDSVCLPMAKVHIRGPFGAIETVAAVSRGLPEGYPYLFSNSSESLLNDRGCTFADAQVMALTRSKARVLAQQLRYGEGEGAKAKELTTESEEVKPDEALIPIPPTENPENGQIKKPIIEKRKKPSKGKDHSLQGSVLAPISHSYERMLGVDREALRLSQKTDPSIAVMNNGNSEGVSSRNISFEVRNGILYRKYRDRRGQCYDQLVVPSPYRKDLLSLCHDHSWAGHLGINKTKKRLLQEFYWPGCFRDVQNFVKTCDACQRAGRSNDKWKAPMVKVPIISEPFRRVVVDLVGPLPKTSAGNRYILTLLCPATKFPEAVPLQEATSVEVVDALLSIFSRLGFPAEMQSDQGTVFTSALTTMFLEKCGVKILHSSVYHPQSNSVERWHATLKKVLRAVCHERKCDWDGCLPGTLFALRTVPHEGTGFAPAELVYGRNLRGPLRLVRELWEDDRGPKCVIEYVLNLMQRLHKCREIVKGNLEARRDASKRYYDRNARTRSFNPGDKVMILRPNRQNKLEVHWDGPAEVISRLSEVNYTVRLPGRKREDRVYHVNLMKPFLERAAIVSIAMNVSEEVSLEVPCFPGNTGPSVEEIIACAVNKDELGTAKVEDLKSLIQEYLECFGERLGRTHLVQHDIELTTEVPFSSKAYRVSPRQLDLMKAEVKRMLRLGVIKEAYSDYCSPLMLVEVPGKEPRPCVDYRRLNAITKDQVYPLPNIEERVELVSRATFISTLDLVRGYWQVPLTERASRYAAFVTPFGVYQPVTMAFGLKNAPFCFSRLMDRVLEGLEEFAVPYLDDVAVFSNDWESHLQHTRTVLERIKGAGLTIKAEKCQFGQARVTYLGHDIGQGKREPMKAKVAAIVNFPRPVNKREVRTFLGMTGYYQHYIPNYSELASTLTDSLRKPEPEVVTWSTEREEAFQNLKKALSSRPVLVAPDFSREFILQCDASNRGLGVVLAQLNEGGEEHPVLYLSRKLTPREEAFSASEKECLSIVWAIQKLGCYIQGTKFTVETDHCPLSWLKQMSNKNGRLLRWSLILQEYNFEVKYRKGNQNKNADGLSRGF